MIRPIIIINGIDKLTDCLPIISTVKNGLILFYQRVHEINRVANPVKTSIIDDLKIHALSKENFTTAISMIPVFGNLFVFAYYLGNALAKAFDGGTLSMPMRPSGYLFEALTESNGGLKKHGTEVIKLYLARNPNYPEEKLAETLKSATILKKTESFEIILNTREHWSQASINLVLTHLKTVEIATLILDKCPDLLTNEQISTHVKNWASNFMGQHFQQIKLFIERFPNLDLNAIGEALENAAKEKDTLETIRLLLERFPAIEEHYKQKALMNASNKGLGEYIKLLLENTPGLVKKELNQLLENAASKGDISTLGWLLDTYEKDVTTASIVKVLKGASGTAGSFETLDSRLVIIQMIMNRHPDLPGEDLEPIMEDVALYNTDCFELFLNRFVNLKPKNLQKLLNDAVFLFREEPSLKDRYARVAHLITTKFPLMQAVNL